METWVPRHTGRYAEAAEQVHSVRELAGALGDEVFLIRVVWLEGRIAAGLGRTEEALRLLGQARRELGRRNLVADAALALLEEAFLLLSAGESIGGLGRGLARLLGFQGGPPGAPPPLRPVPGEGVGG